MKEFETANNLKINEELKIMVGTRFRWARESLNLSRQHFTAHKHFVQIFGTYSIYKIKEIENGYFGKRNVRGELFRFINGLARFYNVAPNSFIDPLLNKKKFQEIIQKGTGEKYAVLEKPLSDNSPEHLKSSEPDVSTGTPVPSSDEEQSRADWGDAPDVGIFCGRETELERLKQWIIGDRCRIVSILGLRGVGKTRLSLKLCSGGIRKTDISLRPAKEIGKEFDCLIWRKLLNAPSLKEILSDLLRFLSPEPETEMPENLDSQLQKLSGCIREQRCLIILDNAESLLKDGKAGAFREGYEDYEQIFRLFGEGMHQSCLLLTAREKPSVLARMEGKNRPVRTLHLGGLGEQECRRIVSGIVSLRGNEVHWKELARRYDGNPLALGLAARHIDEVFFGDIGEFLKLGTPFFDDMRDLLDWHFSRLSDAEKEIMHWLAIHRKPTGPAGLKAGILCLHRKEKIPSALQSLCRRMSIERSREGFTLQPVLMEYMTARLISAVCREIQEGKLCLLHSHSLLRTESEDYIRRIQERMILRPLKEKLETRYSSSAELSKWISSLISQLQEKGEQQAGYAPGNLLNLLCTGENVCGGFDFSHLPIRQAYLAGKMLHHVRFAGCAFSDTAFTQAFADLLCLSFSPDGKLLAAGDSRGIIHIWDSQTGQKYRTLRGHSRKVWTVAFSPDGRMLASGSTDEIVRLWSLMDGKCIAALTGHSNLVNAVAFRPDGEELASCGRDKTVRIWNIRSGECIRILEEHNHWVTSLAFSTDGKQLVTCDYGGEIRIWKFPEGRCEKILHGHTGAVNSLCFSPNRQFFASAGHDRTVRIWDIQEGNCTGILRGHRHHVSSAVFSADGHFLISSSRDRSIRIWNAEKKICLHTVSVLTGKKRHNSPDISAGNSAHKLNPSMNILNADSDMARSLAVSPKGRTFASCGTQQSLHIWHLQKGNLLYSLQGYSRRIRQVIFSPDDSCFAACGSDSFIRIWDVSGSDKDAVLLNKGKGIYTIRFSPDGEYLFSFDSSYCIKIWRIADWNCVDIFRPDIHSVYAADFAPDCRRLLCFAYDSRIRIIDLYNSKKIRSLDTGSPSLRSALFSPDGQKFMVCCQHHSLKVRDTEKGKELEILNEKGKRAHSIAIGSDEKMLAACCYDTTVPVWDVRGKKLICELEGHSAWVRTAAFGADKTILATGGDDYSIRLWNIPEGKCAAVLQGHERSVGTLHFSNDGRMLVSGSEDDTIRLWDVKSGECVKTVPYPRPYEGTDISGTRGISYAQKAALKELGALEKGMQKIGG